MKRVLSVQDISCLGKCSLTIALPVISALGSETVILPTAVLSTHTMFKNFVVRDLSDTLEPFTRHWLDEKVRFDGIYTGYLGTIEQIDLLRQLIGDLRNDDTVVFVDPVMADNGKLYPAFDMDYARKNTELCASADIIAPNITEACFMTGREYRTEYDKEYIRDLLLALSGFGSGVTLLTGVSFEEGVTGVAGYDSFDGSWYYYPHRRIDASYHGTGDLFASVCVGEIMKGLDWRDAVRIAADYTAYTIEVTMKNPEEPWYGVDFEATIPHLINMK
ncbi:MAG: pyridoxamine kinase [Abditibacteriota bacterium]|nr:pyridoxamine kinase [Abditibacteriota bacterium]